MIIPRMEEIDRTVTIHAPSGDGNPPSPMTATVSQSVTIHAPSGDGNSEQNFLFRVC